MVRVISVNDALNQGVTSQSLYRVVQWNEEAARVAPTRSQKERLILQATKLREVAEQVEAQED